MALPTKDSAGMSSIITSVRIYARSRGALTCATDKQASNRAPMDSLLELFCHVDDFCTASLEQLSARRPRVSLCISEIMTILIHFHQSNYRNFKAYYLEYVMTHPGLVSYNRFIELIPSVIVPLNACLGTCTGITFIDSTTLAVCKNPRIHCHKTLPDLPDAAKHPPDGSTLIGQ